MAAAKDQGGQNEGWNLPHQTSQPPLHGAAKKKFFPQPGQQGDEQDLTDMPMPQDRQKKLVQEPPDLSQRWPSAVVGPKKQAQRRKHSPQTKQRIPSVPMEVGQKPLAKQPTEKDTDQKKTSFDRTTPFKKPLRRLAVVFFAFHTGHAA